MQFPVLRRRPLSLFLFLSLLTFTFPGWAQSKSDAKDSDSAQADDAAKDQATDPQTNPQKDSSVDPLKRPISEKQRRENRKSLNVELSKVYKKWLSEDVVYIISDEERDAFKRLSNDEERDNFIEQFWLRRDPTPDTVENEFKEEHYERIAYANEHFPAGVPGWKTDRGKMYIMYGKPDEIEAHPSGGIYDRPQDEGGGSTSTFPFETWRYRYLEDIGQEVIIEFVDTCMCGEYHMTLDRGEKDALLHVPGAGLTMYEQMGGGDKSSRFTNGMESLGTSPYSGNTQTKADLLVMENLFYDQNISKTFDLKGIHGRKVKATSSGSGQKNTILFDGDWIEGRHRSCCQTQCANDPMGIIGQQRTLMLVRPHSKIVLREALKNDSDFLSRSNIMDYSYGLHALTDCHLFMFFIYRLLLGIDEAQKRISCGLVDTIGG